MDATKALAVLDQMLERAGEGRTRDDVLSEILLGKATVFTDGKGFLVCQLIQLDDCLEVRAWLAGGDMKSITGPLKAQAEYWAKLNGASQATIGGRKGWGRVLRDYQGDGELMKVL